MQSNGRREPMKITKFSADRCRAIDRPRPPIAKVATAYRQATQISKFAPTKPAQQVAGLGALLRSTLAKRREPSPVSDEIRKSFPIKFFK